MPSLPEAEQINGQERSAQRSLVPADLARASEHGWRAIEAVRKALAAQAPPGNDPRRRAAVDCARGEAISEGHRRNRSWAREHPGQRDEAGFKREIAPKLDAFSLAEIAAATGLSLAACSRIRAGAKVPHPRHWDALRKLTTS